MFTISPSDEPDDAPTTSWDFIGQGGMLTFSWTRRQPGQVETIASPGNREWAWSLFLKGRSCQPCAEPTRSGAVLDSDCISIH